LWTTIHSGSGSRAPVLTNTYFKQQVFKESTRPMGGLEAEPILAEGPLRPQWSQTGYPQPGRA
jgi:hypothetical protein